MISFPVRAVKIKVLCFINCLVLLSKFQATVIKRGKEEKEDSCKSRHIIQIQITLLGAILVSLN